VSVLIVTEHCLLCHFVSTLCLDGKISYRGKRPARADILLEVTTSICTRIDFNFFSSYHTTYDICTV